MNYNWRPTAARTATADLEAVGGGPRRPTAAGRAEPPGGIGVEEAVEEFIEAAEEGRVPNRSGRAYRPSAMRDVRGSLRYHVVPELGNLPLRDVRREHVQALVDRLAGYGLSESRIRSVVSALRALYGWAIEAGHVDLSPADALTMPSLAHAQAVPGPNDTPQPRHADDPPPTPRRAEPAWGRYHDADRTDDDTSLKENVTWEWREREERATERQSRRERREHERHGRNDRSGRDAYKPIAVMPERILTFALRVVFVLLILAILVSLVGSA